VVVVKTYDEEIKIVRSYFGKIGLSGPTIAHVAHVVAALDEAGVLIDDRSSMAPSTQDVDDECVRRVEMVVDGITYGVAVSRVEGRDNVRFTTDLAPKGLDTIRYEWTGNLKAVQP
jgi:hypothetical protein